MKFKIQVDVTGYGNYHSGEKIVARSCQNVEIGKPIIDELFQFVHSSCSAGLPARDLYIFENLKKSVRITRRSNLRMGQSEGALEGKGLTTCVVEICNDKLESTLFSPGFAELMLGSLLIKVAAEKFCSTKGEILMTDEILELSGGRTLTKSAAVPSVLKSAAGERYYSDQQSPLELFLYIANGATKTTQVLTGDTHSIEWLQLSDFKRKDGVSKIDINLGAEGTNAAPNDSTKRDVSIFEKATVLKALSQACSDMSRAIGRESLLASKQSRDVHGRLASLQGDIMILAESLSKDINSGTN